MALVTTETYMNLRKKVEDHGHGDDLIWANSIPECPDPDDFLNKFIWVLCHSGMKYETGVKIFERIMQAIANGLEVSEAFGHKGKVHAILHVQERRHELFYEWKHLKNPHDRVEWCGKLPWIGGITRYHLARDLGEMSVCKPDRHIERIAKGSGELPQIMCERLALATGDTVACVDAVLWWAAVLKLQII